MARRSRWRHLRRAWREPRNALLAAGIAGVSGAVRLLPLPAALAVGRALGRAAYTTLSRPRRLSLAHLAVAFPDLDPCEQRRIAVEAFRHMGESFAEMALFRRIVRRPGYVDMDGAVLDRALAAGRGLIAVTGHVGNWELLAAWASVMGYPVTVVGRRMDDLHFDSLILRFRAAAGVEVLTRDHPRFLGAVRDALRRNRIVAMLIDQDTRGAGIFVPFFGRLAHTPPGAAVVALRTGAPVVTAFIERRAGGGRLVHITPVAVDRRRAAGGVTELTARLTAAIEAQIRRAPEEWVWWHRRWRRRPTVAPRPAPARSVGGALVSD
jgi:KDO2-lipid IV(A) lauroyltransferase